MTATPRQLQAARLLLNKGYSKQGAAAIVGNLSQESGNNLRSTFTLTTDHGSQGVAQWRLDRLTKLEKFSEDNNLTVTELSTQLFYLIWELESFYGSLNSMLKSGTRSVANLTANFMQIFERPAAKYANLGNRIRQANAVMADLPVTTTAPITEPVAAGAATIGAAGTAVWAWTQGISGPVIAGLITLAAAAAIILGYWVLNHWRKPSATSVAPAIDNPVDELAMALEEFGVAHDRLQAAEAVLLATRAEGDRLLEQARILRNTGTPVSSGGAQ